MTKLQLCIDCASSVYGTRPPNKEYIKSVAKILLGTAATESHFRDRRQKGYDLKDQEGAWGLWQTESAPLTDGIKRLRNDQPLRNNAAEFLFKGEGDEEMEALLLTSPHCLLRLIHTWDRFACLMARIHYYRFSAPIPPTIEDQAKYYKKYYNTMSGKGSVKKYLADWERYAVPEIKGNEL